MIQISNINKSFKKKSVLKNISFDIEKAGSKYKQKSIECFDLRDFESESIIKILLNTFILVLAS